MLTTGFVSTPTTGQMEDITLWLIDLIGKALSGGNIVRVVSWQVVYSGWPNKFYAIAQVEVQYEI